MIYKSVHFYIILFLVFIDQASKYLLRILTKKLEIVEVLNLFNVLHVNIVHVWNTGISFGIGGSFDNSNILFIATTAVIICFLAYSLYDGKLKNYKTSITFIIAGAMGNLIDRLIFGAVYDFIDVSIVAFHWPAFNVADAVIFVGSLLFIILSL